MSWLFILTVLSIFYTVFSIDFLHRVSDYEYVNPLHVGKHSRNKRDLSTKYDKNLHLDETKFQIITSKKQFNINLVKNSALLPRSYSCISQNDETLEVENCYYHGQIEGQIDSNVVLSTCNGLRGMIQEENGESYFIEPHDTGKGSHVFFNSRHLKKERESSCGVNHTHTDAHLNFLPEENHRFRRSSRVKRATSTRKYIEVIAVMDFSMFEKYGTVKATENRAIELMNYVDAVYKTINTRVALKNVIVWDKMNLITITPNPGVMLKEFKQYSVDVLHNRLKLYPDNAQLITNTDFTGSVVGLAGIGVVCTLTSCGVNYDHESIAAVSANTIAHEMGHNLGFYHNENGCVCEKTPCIMNPVAPHSQGQGFTSCTKKTFEERENGGQYPCLFDYPDKLFPPPKCGNGYLEEGETCDCGTEEDCKASGGDKCCDFKTCTLQAGAKCADGMCCEKCQFKSQGALCRKQMHSECDLEEFCAGFSAECPRNTYVQDGVNCSGGRGLCFKGLCKTHDAQCKVLWGDVAIKGEDVCFKANDDGDQYGHCGVDDRDQFVACAPENLLCGKIQCQGEAGKSLPNLPRLGTNRGSVKRREGNINCRVAKMDFPAELDDPTLTADGTKCGDNKICLENKCKNISTIGSQMQIQCKKPCLNGGVCNSNGNCHCPVGWACPYCELAGPGGSLDSGQGCLLQDDCECLTPLVKAMLVLFLLVLPLCGLIGYLAYRHRGNIRDQWGKYRQPGKVSGDDVKPAKTRFTAGDSSKTSDNVTLKTGNPSHSNNAQYDNPYANNTSVVAAKAPSRKAPPSVPGTQSSRPFPAKAAPSTVRSSSPRSGGGRTPGKLPQISAYNQMDVNAGNVKKPYR